MILPTILQNEGLFNVLYNSFSLPFFIGNSTSFTTSKEALVLVELIVMCRALGLMRLAHFSRVYCKGGGPQPKENPTRTILGKQAIKQEANAYVNIKQ